MSTEKKDQKTSKPLSLSMPAAETLSPEVNVPRKPPTLRENVATTIKVLMVASAILGLLWILDLASNR